MNNAFNLNHFKLLIFDWDGTLIDSIDWIVYCLQQAALQCNLEASSAREAKNVIGLSIQNAMRTLFPDVDAITLSKLVSAYSDTYFSKTLSRNDLFVGAYQCLTHLKNQGFLLAVATGKTRVGLNEALKSTITEDLFVATRCADETASKPDPQMITEILNVTGIDKSQTLLVGDSIHDIQMAHNAGISAIAVSCGANTSDELERYQPVLCLSEFIELQHFLR